MHIYACTYMCMYVHMYVYACLHAWMYACMHECICVYIAIHYHEWWSFEEERAYSWCRENFCSLAKRRTAATISREMFMHGLFKFMKLVKALISSLKLLSFSAV